MKIVPYLAIALSVASQAHAFPDCTETRDISSNTGAAVQYGVEPKKDLPIEDATLRINGPYPLFPGGKIRCYLSDDKSRTKFVRTATEVGSLNGVAYSFEYEDGRGRVGGYEGSTLGLERSDDDWRLFCLFDKINDERGCVITKSDVSIGVGNDGQPIVLVGADHYPGTNITIRVGKNSPITASEKTGFSIQQVKQIIAQIPGAPGVITRYHKWPYETPRDAEVSLSGFSDAWTIVQTIWQRGAESRQ